MHTNPTFWMALNVQSALCLMHTSTSLLVPCLLNDFNDLFGIRNRGVVVFGHDLTQPSMHSMQPTELRTTDSAHHLNLKLYSIYDILISKILHYSMFDACMHLWMDGWHCTMNRDTDDDIETMRCRILCFINIF